MYLRYLVTGVLSPVGRLVAKTLSENGASVRVLVPPEADLSSIKDLDVEVIEGEIFDKDSMKEFFKIEDSRQSVVIHTEEVVNLSGQSDLNMRRINVSGTMNVVDQCLKNKIGRLVYLGSAYSINPNASLENAVIHFDRTKVEGDYAKSKAEASAHIMEKVSLNKLNAVLLLPTFIIGPGFDDDYDMNRIVKKYLDSHVSIVNGGHAFVDIRDVVEALLAICENGQTGGSYVLNGEHKNTKDFFQDVSKANGSTDAVKTMPKWMMGKTLGKFVDTYYRIAKKDNPKEVYALFMNSPEQKFNSTVDDLMPSKQIRSVYDSINDLLHAEEADLTVKMAGADVADEEAEDVAVESVEETTVEEATEEVAEEKVEEKAEEPEVEESTEEVKEEATEEEAEESAEEPEAAEEEALEEEVTEEVAEEEVEVVNEAEPEVAETAEEAEEPVETVAEVATDVAEEAPVEVPASAEEESVEEAAEAADEPTEEPEAEPTEETPEEPEEVTEEEPVEDVKETEADVKEDTPAVPIWSRMSMDMSSIDSLDDLDALDSNN